MSLPPSLRLVAALLLILVNGAGQALAQTAVTGIQRTNHYKFLGAWWTKNDTAQPEANKIDIRSPADRKFKLIVNRTNLGLNNVVLDPDPVGSRYRAEPAMVRIPNTTWGKVVVLQVVNRNGKYFLEALDRVTFQVESTAGIGGGFPATFSFELVRHN